MTQASVQQPSLLRPAATAAREAEAPPLAWPAPGQAPGWKALRDCPLGGDGPPVRLALLHPAIGVALIGPRAQGGPDPAARLRRRLEAVRFTAVFPGHLPIVTLGQVAAPDLPAALQAAFARLPPLRLPGGDAWVGAVERALAATHPPPAPPVGAGQQRRAVRRRRRHRNAVIAAALAFALALVVAGAVLGLATGWERAWRGKHQAGGDHAPPPAAAATPSVRPAPGVLPPELAPQRAATPPELAPEGASGAPPRAAGAPVSPPGSGPAVLPGAAGMPAPSSPGDDLPLPPPRMDPPPPPPPPPPRAAAAPRPAPLRATAPPDRQIAEEIEADARAAALRAAAKAERQRLDERCHSVRALLRHGGLPSDADLDFFALNCLH